MKCGGMVVNVEALINSGERYLDLMGSVPVHYLALAILSCYLSVVLYALRWKVILRGTGDDVGFIRLLKKVPLPISTASVIYEIIHLEIQAVFVVPVTLTERFVSTFRAPWSGW
ncbi:hypothetical protein [Thermococcus sp.]|uniref:hypothetical protein n=1 Tax=Thermococcus sp. TaxID=35749 RepID=UPI0026101E88|nr:hypothetical protein [Thermococcus sp.]